ncbi:hypothetical protein [Cupriavidus necator]|uniref:hypothetical protein n=1 Tax=Cupriavidus necator TaxID=106590 RepID=UPI0013052F9D|nr:hypothetical protein [Cupriavidus necator]MDX6007248.1 hypothetical protein [Cupriavidus necator]
MKMIYASLALSDLNVILEGVPLDGVASQKCRPNGIAVAHDGAAPMPRLAALDCPL